MTVLALVHWYRQREWKWIAFALIAWWTVPTVAMVLSEFVVGSVFRARTAIWVEMLFFLLVAIGAVQIKKKWILIPVVALLLSSNVYGTAMNYNKIGTQWDIITERIASKVEPGDGIIFCPGFIACGY